MSFKSHIHLAEIQLGARSPQVSWQGNLRDTFDAVLDARHLYKSDYALSKWETQESALYCWSLKFASKVFVKVGISAHPPERMKGQIKSMPPGFTGEMLGFSYPGLSKSGVEELESVMLAACMKYMPEINSEWIQVPPKLLGDWTGYAEKSAAELLKRYGIQRTTPRSKRRQVTPHPPEST